MIKHANIIYARDIHAIGGVETFVYELVKKYKDYDMAVVCKNIAKEQEIRLRKYCKVYVHKNEQIQCKVIITNWDTTILEYVNKEAKKYTVLHTDYSNETEILGLPKDREDITYIGITESSKKAFEDVSGITRTILCRNPYTLEKDEKPLMLVSATRMTKIKDNGRMTELANALDRANIKYIWFIITTDEYLNNKIFKNPNVIYIKNRLDVASFLNMADWYVQLSICEGDSYSLREALYRGLPIVVCDLPYFKEYGIEDNVNALFYNSDNSNALDIAYRMINPLKFSFKQIEDNYNNLLDKTKSYYEEERRMKFKVRATDKYTKTDTADKNLSEEESLKAKKEIRVVPEKGREWIVDTDRKDVLVQNGFVEVVEEIKDEPTKKDTKKKAKK